MTGVNVDVSADPYPDSFKTLGANAVGIFANTAPRTDWAGVRVARNAYQVDLLWVLLLTTLSRLHPRRHDHAKSNRLADYRDVTWLSETPTTGTIPADTGNVPVTVGFNAGDASITQPGTYTAMLKVANEDDGNTPLSVPVTMTVLSSATQGKLNGTVSGLLYCDGGPGTPLNNASVHIFDGVSTSITLKTDTAGYYQQWLEAGTYTVTVSAANYLGQAVTGVIVSGGVTTTQDCQPALAQGVRRTRADQPGSNRQPGRQRHPALQPDQSWPGEHAVQDQRARRRLQPVCAERRRCVDRQ